MCCCVSDFLEMKQKTKDNLIYLGVAGITVAALTSYIFYTDKTMGKDTCHTRADPLGHSLHSCYRRFDLRAILAAPSSTLAMGYFDHCCLG